MTEILATIEWNSRLEKYFADTGEKAHGLSWLHKKAQERYSGLRNYIDLPVIILGVLNGSVSIGSSSLFGDTPFASVAVGIIALITAILSTISSYFKWAARAEAHRIAGLQYSKLYRFLAVQCSLPRHERMSPAELLKYTKDAYDRMAEIAPLVPPEVIQMFAYKFNKPEYKDLSKPEECNGLEHIIIYSTHELMSPTFSPRVISRRPSNVVVSNTPANRNAVHVPVTIELPHSADSSTGTTHTGEHTAPTVDHK